VPSTLMTFYEFIKLEIRISDFTLPTLRSKQRFAELLIL
jgi:hypothetical protein